MVKVQQVGAQDEAVERFGQTLEGDGHPRQPLWIEVLLPDIPDRS